VRNQPFITLESSVVDNMLIVSKNTEIRIHAVIIIIFTTVSS